MKKTIKWLNAKKHEDTAFTQFLKFAYALGQKTWLHTTIAAVLGIIIPIFWDNKQYIWFFIFIVMLIFDVIYAHICNLFKEVTYSQRKFASEILSDQSSLLKSIVIEIENNNNWKTKIFKTVSDLVCEKIYRNFKECFNCETRVAIEYVFNKDTKVERNVKHVKMAGRRSGNRAIVRKSTVLEKRKKYYSYKIFINNNTGINILDEEEINNDAIWYKNPNGNVNVKKYVGIAVTVCDEKEVKFILEIDFIDEFVFGDDNDKEDIKTFINQYMVAYINIINLAYLLNLNGKKQMPEV